MNTTLINSFQGARLWKHLQIVHLRSFQVDLTLTSQPKATTAKFFSEIFFPNLKLPVKECFCLQCFVSGKVFQELSVECFL